MDLKEKALKVIEKKHPLMRWFLNEAEVKCEDDLESRKHPTIHVISQSAFVHDHLGSKMMWPRLHDVLFEIVGRDFTLNFVLDEKKAEKAS
jgi:hypothetical protein